MARLLAVLIIATLLVCGAADAKDLSGQMLLSGGGHIDLYRPASGDLRRVARGGNEGVLFPSGEELAYIREVGCFPTGENSCSAEYSIFEKPLDEEATAPGRGTFGPTDFFVRAVDVAPRGKLVFSAKPDPGPTEGWARQMEIYAAKLDGEGVTQLTHDEAFDNDPVVSPDGTRIAFSRRVHGRGQIFTMRLDGSHLVRVTRDKRRNRLPAWSPDGHRLVYVSQSARPSAFGEREIYSVAAGGGRGRRLTRNETSEEGAAAYSPRWALDRFSQRRRRLGDGRRRELAPPDPHCCRAPKLRRPRLGSAPLSCPPLTRYRPKGHRSISRRLPNYSRRNGDP